MERADELLRQMSVEEKAMQLSAMYPLALIGTDGLIRDQLDAHLKHGIGQISALAAFGHKPPETVAKTANAIQPIWSPKPA
jgi:beta-glucosidase